MPVTAPEDAPARSGGDGGAPPLHVGIPLASRTPEAWIVDLLERLERDPRLQVHAVLVGTPADVPDAPPPTRGERLRHRLLRSPLLDSPRFPADARRPVPLPTSVEARLTSGERIGRMAGGSAGQHPTDPHDAPGRLDVLLDLGVRDAALERRLASDTPLWSVGATRLERRVERALLARAPLFRLHVHARPTGDPHARERVLAVHALPRQSYSITDLVGAAFAALPGVLVARLGWLAAGRDPRDVEEASLPTPIVEHDVGDEASFRRERAGTLREADTDADEPGTRAVLALLVHRNLARVVARLGPERWQLAVTGATATATGAAATSSGTTTGSGSTGTVGAASTEDDRSTDEATGIVARIGAIDLDDWRALEPPADRLWADPHLLRHAGETHLFFEELVDGEKNAHVVTARLDARGALAEPPRTALIEPFHLSYPLVFEHEGEHWMLPETAGRRAVSLYRATRFPDAWTRSHDLLTDVDLADSTLHRHDGRWWLFTNRFTDRRVDERDELLIFFAESLHGPWTPHALNPVVTGVDRARMAGPVVEDGGHRYRPSQYGAVRYGHGINLARIDVLTPNDYRETPVHRLLPRPGSRWLGCHSLASAGSLAVIDRVRRRPWGPGRLLRPARR